MAILIVHRDDQEGTVHCDECCREFILIWQPQYQGDQPQYCPFCGEEIEEITSDDEA